MLHTFLAVLVSLVAGFVLGVWFCQPVRDELKALRAAALDEWEKAKSKP